MVPIFCTVVQNNRQTQVTATASTGVCRCMYTDYRGITWTDTHTCGSTSKYSGGSICTEYFVSECTDVTGMGYCISVCMDIYTDSTGVHGSKCPYISTKGMGVHRVMFTDKSTVKTAVCGRTNAYDKYSRYKPIPDIDMDVVSKVRKVISYDDALQQGY